MKSKPNNINDSYQIAIDGPAGSGKSTIAKLLAEKLEILYVDSGAMYRALTLYLIEERLTYCTDRILKRHLKKITIDFIKKQMKQVVLLNGKDVSEKIRTTEVNKLVSEISSRKPVRLEMVKRQRELSSKKSVVMDGRDIGTTVFKNADLKIYLTASPLIRAKRRQKDLKAISEKIALSTLERQIIDRDDFDSSRLISPLCKAQDAVVIDSSKLNITQVLNEIMFFVPIRAF